MAHGQLYYCGSCGFEKWLPEHPTLGPRQVRTGCEQCTRITLFYARGRVRPYGPPI